MTTILDKILQGSANLDRMEREILGVTATVAGIFKKVAWKYADSVRTYRDRREHELNAPTLPGRGMKWTIQMTDGYCLKIRYRKDNGGFEDFGYKNGTHSLEMDKIAKVHHALPMFVEGMIAKFPWLTEEMDPILKAA